MPPVADPSDASSAFVLHHEVLAGDAPARTALVLHGALGSGQNFRGVVRRLMALRPDYAFVLVDLRAHGKSHPAPPPHTLSAAANDLKVLARELRRSHPELPSVTSLVGHSLGGKVALEAIRQNHDLASQVFALDSDPGSRDGDTAHEIQTVIRGVRSVAMPAASRKAVVQALQQRGLSSGLSNWMTTNLEREDGVLKWAFDLDAIEELLSDYFTRDLWPVLENPPPGVTIELVVAEHSDRWSEPMRRRAQELADGQRMLVHRIQNAGHWLHVDNPEALLELMASRLEC